MPHAISCMHGCPSVQISAAVMVTDRHVLLGAFALLSSAMAWRCHGATHAEMVKALRNAKQIRSQNVFEAMLATDRSHYVDSSKSRRHGRAAADSESNVEVAYCDEPQPIGSNATISAPHMHAMQLELLAKHCTEVN